MIRFAILLREYSIFFIDMSKSESEQLNDNDEVEVESGNDDVVIEVPFNPNNIKVVTRPYSIGQIVSDLKDEVIDLDTDFQRLPGLWDNQKKSRFIESLLLNLPIPAFYFSEKENNDWEVVDGLQRVSTIKSFVIDADLRLSQLEFLKEFNGKYYKDLPIALQKRISRFVITLNVIEKVTPSEVKYNIFKRINQGGLVLSPQEIRHAINQGKPSELVADLVRGVDDLNKDKRIRIRNNDDGTTTELRATPEGKAFRNATDHRIGSSRMEDRDFATRFVAFYLIPYEKYEPDLDTFLNKGMAKVKELKPSEIKKLKADFKKAMEASLSIFASDAFRKRFRTSDNRKPINKALFEVLSVSIGKLSETDLATLVKNKSVFKKKLIGLHNAKDGKFLRSITQGTAQRETVDQRFSDIEKIVKETIQYDQKA